MSKERLISFTDAVIAIIITILVLDLTKPSNMSLSLNSGHDAGSGNKDSNNLPQIPTNNELLGKNQIKTVNIPNTIAQNLDKQLKKKELELFQNFLKLQRK